MVWVYAYVWLSIRGCPQANKGRCPCNQLPLNDQLFGDHPVMKSITVLTALQMETRSEQPRGERDEIFFTSELTVGPSPPLSFSLSPRLDTHVSCFVPGGVRPGLSTSGALDEPLEHTGHLRVRRWRRPYVTSLLGYWTFIVILIG